jgi:hypothetical protein
MLGFVDLEDHGTEEEETQQKGLQLGKREETKV